MVTNTLILLKVIHKVWNKVTQTASSVIFVSFPGMQIRKLLFQLSPSLGDQKIPVTSWAAIEFIFHEKMAKLACGSRRSRHPDLFAHHINFPGILCCTGRPESAQLVDSSCVYCVEARQKSNGATSETSQLLLSQQLKGCAKHFIKKVKPRVEWGFSLGLIV